MQKNYGGTIVALIALAFGLYAYKAGKFTTFFAAANGGLRVNRGS